MSIAIRFDSAVARKANTSFGYGLHYSSHITYTKLDAAWHAGFTAAIESQFADVHPPKAFTKAERDQFYAGRTEGYRELEHQEEQARLATVGDAVLASNRYDRDEVRGGWGHAANEFEAMAEAV
jgi:hypothetical protein